MSNKTTMILTFIVSVVVPFIQEVVDLIEALKGKASSNTVTAKKVASDFQTDVAQLVEPVANSRMLSGLYLSSGCVDWLFM